MDDVDDKDDVGKTQSDELDQPEAEEGDGGVQVVADVGTSRLDGVAHESVLLVLVEGVSGKKEGQDTEKDHHYEPHFPWEIKRMVREVQIFKMTLKTRTLFKKPPLETHPSAGCCD